MFVYKKKKKTEHKDPSPDQNLAERLSSVGLTDWDNIERLISKI